MKSAARVAGIVLAAGKATRMGRTKQLLPFRGKSVLEWVVDHALASGLHRVVVVLGHDAELLEPLLRERDVTVVVNPQYGEGQSSSLKAGLGALTNETEAALFLLGDQPLVTPEIIDRILSAYAASPSPIVMPVCEGRRGNPVLFARETFPAMRNLSGDCGARGIFEQYAGRILAVPVESQAILADIDTEEDYQRLLQDS
ncbi:molybdenum cofactor cytidylyltransferase [Geobacter argillaceus]|uniref:Molybdenum cofactor cytidylyltransferase n=1 Tax=Geobacter argillaceus TaxID=345631 RepID=A0A562V5M4_9BACT|nr:molybdenum cofactor cytidylyltransferase [Geobacter argillaceus]TWJ13190.1 molybdenum cofactor cytidylyltransferase [Geobacter argillaceus]